MATVSQTNVTEITTKVTGKKGTGLNIGGMPMACFRIAAGAGAAGDTVFLQSAEVPVIHSVVGPVSHNIPATNVTGVTSVIVTFLPVSTVATATIGNLDVWIVGPVPTS